MLIEVQVEEGVALIKLAHPPVNALSDTLRDELKAVIDRLALDRSIGAVVLTGDDTFRDIFCGGADITEFELSEDSNWGSARAEREMRHIAHLRSQRLPLIAAVNGPALGGGLELVLACDVVIASNNATFGFPEIKLGAFPGSQALSLAARIIGVNRTRFLCLSGQTVDAKWMYDAGVIADLVPRTELISGAKALAQDIAQYSPESVRAVREIVDSIAAADPAESSLIKMHCDIVTRSPTAKERVNAFFASRASRAKN